MTTPAHGAFSSDPGAGAAGTLPAPQPASVDEQVTGDSMWAVVFAGGIGSRFWPLSSPDRPKPLLALVTGSSLLEDTVERLQPLIPPERVLVLTSSDIAAAIRAAIPAVPEENILVEPRPLGTSAALAWGCHEVSRRAGPTTSVCATHVDLAISFAGAYRESLRRASVVATRENAIVALGIRPTRAEPSFGYMQPGDAVDAGATLSAGAAFNVTEFFEKPAEARAEQFVQDGGLWHAGVVIGTAKIFLEKLARYTPEIEPGFNALAAADLERFARTVRPVSIERGLLERVRRLLVLPCDFGWDDVGTWASLRRARELDDDGNGALGPVEFVDAVSNIVHTEAGTVVLFGVSKLLVVNLDGLTFVTTLDRAADLRPLLDALPGSMRMDPGGRKAR